MNKLVKLLVKRARLNNSIKRWHMEGNFAMEQACSVKKRKINMEIIKLKDLEPIKVQFT